MKGTLLRGRSTTARTSSPVAGGQQTAIGGGHLIPSISKKFRFLTAPAWRLEYAVTHGRGGKGCVICLGAGNGNESVDTTAMLPIRM